MRTKLLIALAAVLVLTALTARAGPRQTQLRLHLAQRRLVIGALDRQRCRHFQKA